MSTEGANSKVARQQRTFLKFARWQHRFPGPKSIIAGTLCSNARGEWFFVPVRKDVRAEFVLKNEPMRKTPKNKPHWIQELYRDGGETVYVSRNKVLSQAEYNTATETNPDRMRKQSWRVMVRNANVYARGTIRHSDHSTVWLEDWHRVFMNAEFTTSAVAFLD
jgi:hypothetical protein